MLSLVENAKAAVSDSRDVRGTLQIGALQSTASARLPDVLKVYAARHARVDIAVKTGCHYRHRLERYLGGEGIGVLSPMEFGTIDGIIGCVAAGLGI